MTYADQIDVFHGRVTHNSAQVYVRVSSLAGGEDWSITGNVRGPIAPGTRTLPTTTPLTDLGTGPTLLASCAIPDPTFWTTQLPGTYATTVQLRYRGEVVETVDRSLGIRFFGASGRDLRWQGKRWVLRGVSTPIVADHEIDLIREQAGVIVTTDASSSQWSSASSSGVLLVVELSSADVLQQLRLLSRCPAAAMAILPSDCNVTSQLRAAAPNVLFAQPIDPVGCVTPADWAQVLYCDATNLEAFAGAAKKLALPIIARRRLNGDYTLLEARRECDRLQRDLAAIGDFAGYVVQI